LHSIAPAPSGAKTFDTKARPATAGPLFVGRAGRAILAAMLRPALICALLALAACAEAPPSVATLDQTRGSCANIESPRGCYDGVHRKLEVPYDGVHRRLEADYDGVHRKLEVPYDGVHRKLDAPYDGVHRVQTAEYDGVHRKLEAPYDGVHRRLEVPYDGVYREIPCP
jgi:hypothetical protein